MAKLKTCQLLINEVIRMDLCTLCGACVEMCPYFLFYRGRVIQRDVCRLSTGRCSNFCPRISLDLDNMSKIIFGTPYTWDGLGTTKQILMARATNAKVKARAQDAGAVSALIMFAIEEGLIDSAILTGFKNKSMPKGVIASNTDEVLNCAGSNYMATATLEAFNRGIQDVARKHVGFVGTPCQVMALAKMKESMLGEQNHIEKLEFIIGLFCTWALSFPEFARFLEREVPDPIIRYNVPPHPANFLQAYTEKRRIDIPLDKTMQFIRPSCHVCHDLTAEFSDLSVGSGRGEVSEWNTIIVRTKKGMEVLSGAKGKGFIEIREIPEKNLIHLKEASHNKKKRALKNIIRKTGSVENLLHFKLQPNKVKHLIEG